jgi:hypothetical protein
MTITSNNNAVTITAWDVDLDGSLALSSNKLSLLGSTASETIGVGLTGKDMHIDRDELQRVNSGGLRVGGSQAGNIYVTTVTADSSQNVANMLTLFASRDAAQTFFSTGASIFNALAVQADNGILVQQNVDTDTGVLTIDADSDNTAVGSDSDNTLSFDGQRTVNSVGMMTLDATSGGIIRSGTDTMTLKSESGILVNDNFSSNDANQQLHANADSMILAAAPSQ